MKKKLLILSLFVVLVFALTGCTRELPTDFDSDYYSQLSQAWVETVLGMAQQDEQIFNICANDIGYVFSEDDVSIDLDILQDMCSGTVTAMEEAGEPGSSVKAISYEMENDTVTVVCTVAYAERDVDYELTYSVNEKSEYNPYVTTYELTQAVVSTQYTKGELLQMAGMNTLMGIGIVFVVLVFISLIISLFRFLPGSGARQQKAKEAAKQEAKQAVSLPVQTEKKEPEGTDSTSNLMDNKELVAVITAAVYAANADNSVIISSDKLVVRSIKRASR